MINKILMASSHLEGRGEIILAASLSASYFIVRVTELWSAPIDR